MSFELGREPKKPWDSLWATTNELKFIAGVGKQKYTNMGYNRVTALKNYIDVSETKRVRWGGVNKWEAIAFAKEQLKNELIEPTGCTDHFTQDIREKDRQYRLDS